MKARVFQLENLQAEYFYLQDMEKQPYNLTQSNSIDTSLIVLLSNIEDSRKQKQH